MQPPLFEPHENRQPMRRDNTSMISPSPSPAEAGEILEFGRFRVLLRRRQLLADGAPIALGTRAFDLLLVLLEADGSLMTKDEILSRVWPDIVVAEENLKVQICLLRRALGPDREFIRTDFGRGYRFTATIHSTAARSGCRRAVQQRHPSDRRLFAKRTYRRARPQSRHPLRTAIGNR